MAFRDQWLLNAGLEEGLITEAQHEVARKQARCVHLDELHTLCYLQRIPLARFYHAFASQNGLYYLRPSQLKISQSGLRQLPQNLIQQLRILPVDIEDKKSNITYVVTDSPNNPMLDKQLDRIFRTGYKLCVTDPVSFETCLKLDTHFSDPNPGFDAVAEVEELLNQAYMHRASDIHIEPADDQFLIRLRVDGRLQQFGRRFSISEGVSLVSRIKVMGNLDIAETRMPQDGGTEHTTPLDNAFELRIATAPTKHGERITLRLLGTDSQLFTLRQLGMSEATLRQFRTAIAQPHGIVLITGPTGSGKSTTLYAALDELKDESLNILTAEDPVEMVVEGAAQVQVNAKVSFASALRSFLRHDPDVIMVGEIRDSETGEIALKAATTGHMVLSTLHTNSAIASITRLQNIGLEPFMIAASLQGVMAQRLARKLCQNCKMEMPADLAERKLLSCSDDEEVVLSLPQGCALCDGTGYSGRIAIFETLWMDDELRELISTGADEQELRKCASHFTSLAADGREKVLQGLTTLEELRRLGLLGLFEEGAV